MEIIRGKGGQEKGVYFFLFAKGKVVKTFGRAVEGLLSYTKIRFYFILS